MGSYEKIIMEFEEPFWPADVPFIGCCCPQPSPVTQPISIPASTAGALGEIVASRLIPKLAVSASSAAVARPMLPASTFVAPNSGLGATAEAAAAAAAAAGSSALDTAAAKCHHQPAAVVEHLTHPPKSIPAIPVLLENYLWSNGVPVLSAAVTGDRARMVAATSAAAAVAAGEKVLGDEDTWRASHAREMYNRLIKPALVKGLGRDGEELPEPVSVLVTRRVTLKETPLKSLILHTRRIRFLGRSFRSPEHNNSSLRSFGMFLCRLPAQFRRQFAIGVLKQPLRERRSTQQLFHPQVTELAVAFGCVQMNVFSPRYVGSVIMNLRIGHPRLVY